MPIIKGARAMPCHAPAGVVVFGGKDARWGEHMGMVCVVVRACVWLRLGVVAPCTLVDQGQGVRGMEQLVSTYS